MCLHAMKSQRLLRWSPTVPLPLRTSALPSAVRPPCALRHPRKPITSSLRQLQSSTTHFELLPNPSNVKQHRFPTKSLGLVDFVGFDGEGYLPHLPRSMRRDRANWREHDFKAEERTKETMKHPIFQPQVRVVNEVAQLELSGALLDYTRSREMDRLDTIGIPQLSGGYCYTDQNPGDPDELVTISFGSPSFYTLIKAPVWEDRESYGYKGRPLGLHRFIVEEAQSDYKEATEAELDQVVVRSPYFKLSHDHHREFQPLGSSPVALLRPEPTVIERSLSNLLLAGIYRAPRDGTFWLRDVWSAMEDYEQRILLFYGLKGHLTDHTQIDDIVIDGDMIQLIWGS